jgi:hypothetical protein
MEEQYKKLFKTLAYEKAPIDLEKKIKLRILAEEERLSRNKALIFGLSTATSLSLSLWAAFLLIRSLSESGFWNYLSIVVSENVAVISYWRELSFSLVESLPLVGLIIFFATAGSFIWSFANMSKNFGSFGMSPN